MKNGIAPFCPLCGGDHDRRNCPRLVASTGAKPMTLIEALERMTLAEFRQVLPQFFRRGAR